MDIAGHAALVTGAASGLGAATAKALADAGAKVACLDLNLEGAEKVASAIGGKAFQADVTQADSLEKAVADAAAAHGAARVAVSCAGIAPPKRIVGRDGPQALDTFAQTIQVNLVGTFNLLRLAAHGMQGLEALETGERGVIVNTASVAAEDGQMGQAAYSASKGGVVGMTLPIARDLSRELIRVNTILPGIFDTPLMQGAPDNVKQALAASVPNPARLGNPDEYASLACEMIRNGYFNGEDVRLDGAIRMAPR